MLSGLTPMHPGELLREEVLPALGMNKSEMARRLRISRTTLYDLLNERTEVTPAMALRLGRFCGNGPEVWLQLQQTYALHHQAQAMADELTRIEPAA